MNGQYSAAKRISSVILAAMLLLAWGCTQPSPVKWTISAAPTAVAMPLDPLLTKQAQQELLADAAGKDAEVRTNAIEALSEVAPELANNAILNGLSDRDASVRFSACMAAGQLRLKSAYTPLLALMHDADGRVQVAQRFALHRLGDTRFSRDLEHFAVDADPTLRGSAAQVLGLLGEPSAVKLLWPLSQDKVASVRLQASESLWRLGEEVGFQSLVGYSVSKQPDEQIIALIGLASRNDPRAIPFLHAQLDNYVEVSLVATRALGMLGSDEGYALAVKFATSKDARRRSLAALAMGAIGRSDLQGNLRTLLSDSNAIVRLSAATAILQLKAP